MKFPHAEVRCHQRPTTGPEQPTGRSRCCGSGLVPTAAETIVYAVTQGAACTPRHGDESSACSACGFDRQAAEATTLLLLFMRVMISLSPAIRARSA